MSRIGFRIGLDTRVDKKKKAKDSFEFRLCIIVTDCYKRRKYIPVIGQDDEPLLTTKDAFKKFNYNTTNAKIKYLKSEAEKLKARLRKISIDNPHALSVSDLINLLDGMPIDGSNSSYNYMANEIFALYQRVIDDYDQIEKSTEIFVDTRNGIRRFMLFSAAQFLENRQIKQLLQKTDFVPNRNLAKIAQAWIDVGKPHGKKKNKKEQVNEFLNEITLFFDDLTPGFLSHFSNWYMNQNPYKRPGSNPRNTVSIKLRNLKTVLNHGIYTYNVFPEEKYPFRRHKNEHSKFSIPGYTRSKKAIDTNTHSALGELQVDQKQRESIDYFDLCYGLNGAYPVDLAYIKQHQYDPNSSKLLYERKKFGERIVDPIMTEASLSDYTHLLIKKYKKISLDPDDFLFDIIENGMNKIQRRKRINYFGYKINKSLRSSCEKAKMQRITLGAARHTFASLLSEKGYSSKEVMEKLGNRNLSITEGYIQSLRPTDDESIKIEANSLMTPAMEKVLRHRMKAG